MRFAVSMLLSGWLVVSAAYAATSTDEIGESRSGSICVQTDHPGFMVLVEGPVVVSGITPFTGYGLPVGKYQVKLNQRGYTSSRERVFLRSNGAESLTLDPRPKRRLGAAFRSIIIPGWGQKYNDQPNWGNFVFWMHVVATAGHGIASWEYYSARNDLENSAGGAEDVWNRASDAYDIYLATGWILGVSWTLNILDAFIQFPAYEKDLFPGGGKFSLGPGSAGDGFTLSYKVSMK